MASWNEIVQRNAALVVNAAMRVVGNSSDAEDVAQDVFLEASQRWQPIDDHNWAGLLRRMAVFRALDLLRQRKSAETVHDMANPSTELDPSEIAIARELEDRTRLALQRLAPREAEVFCLHHFEKQTHEEIANELGLARGAVATALCKARSRLTAELSSFQYKASKQ